MNALQKFCCGLIVCTVVVAFPMGVFAFCTGDARIENETPTDPPVTPPVTPPTGPEYDYVTVEYRRKTGGQFLEWTTINGATETRLIDNMNWFTPVESYPTNAWGSRTDRTAVPVAGKSGFFRTGKIGDRWYLIDPEGYPNIVRGTQHIYPGKSAEHQAAFATRFGTEEVWAAETIGLLTENVFNYVAHSPSRIERFPANQEGTMLRPAGKKMAYAVNFYFVRTFRWDMRKNLGFSHNDEINSLVLIFDPTFPAFIDSLARTKCALFAGDKHLLGYYLDNELPFNAYQDRNGREGIELVQFLELDQNKYAGARTYAEDFLRKRGKDPSARPIAEDDRVVFRDSVVTNYFRMTTTALRKYDTEHLILGSRLHDWTKYNERTVRACAKYCNVVSVNYYGRWQPEPTFMSQLSDWTQKPILITEFYTKGEDANYQGTPLSNVEGAGWLVRTQADRGRYYQHFCLGLLEAKNVVGWHHFQYGDNYGGESVNSNKGIVSIEYEPYTDFLERMKQVHVNVYKLADYYDSK